MDLFELIGWTGKTVETLTDEEIAELQSKIIETNRQLSANNKKNIPIETLLNFGVSFDIEEIIVNSDYQPEDYENLNLIDGAKNLVNIDFIIENSKLIALENLNWEIINFIGKNEDKIIPFILNNIEEINLKNLALSNMPLDYIRRLSTDPTFEEQFDYTTYAIRHDVSIDFLKQYKSFINWVEYSKSGKITKDFLNEIDKSEEIIILLDSSIIEKRNDIDKDAKNVILSNLSKRKQEAVLSFNELLQETPHVDRTCMDKWIERGYDPRMLADLPVNIRGLLLEAANNGLDIRTMSQRLKTVPNITPEQTMAYMTGLRYGVDINLEGRDSIPVILAKIDSKRKNKFFQQYVLASHRRDGHNITKEQADAYAEISEALEFQSQIKKYNIPNVNTSPEIVSEIAEAINYNINRKENQKPIPLDILENSKFNAEQMKLYRLAFINNMEVSPDDIHNMSPAKVKNLINFIEKGYDVSKYLTSNLHYKNFYKEHPEMYPTTEQKRTFFELYTLITNTWTEAFLKAMREFSLSRQISNASNPLTSEVTEELKKNENISTDDISENLEEKSESTSSDDKKEEQKLENPHVEKDKEEKEEKTVETTTDEEKVEETIETKELEENETPKTEEKEEAENPHVEKEEDSEPALKGRGKILTREDMNVSRIQLDAAILATNEQIADLVTSTILTQKEFDTMTWTQLAQRFEQDVENLNKALQIIKEVQDKGIKDLDYIDVKALIALRDKKIEQQKFANNFFVGNKSIYEATHNAEEVQDMLQQKASQQMEYSAQGKIDPIFALLPSIFQTTETNISITDSKNSLCFELCGTYKGEKIKITCLYEPEKEKYIMMGNTKNKSSMQLMYDPNTKKINRVRTTRSTNEVPKETDVVIDPITGQYRILDRRQVKDEKLQSIIENFFIDNHDAIIQHYNELSGNTKEVKVSKEKHVDTPEQKVTKKITDYMMNAIAKPLGINTSEIKIIDSGDSTLTIEVKDMIKIKFTADKENADAISFAILSDTTKGKAQIIADVLSTQILPKNFDGIKLEAIKIEKPTYKPKPKKLLETAEIESDRITKTIQDEFCTIFGKDNFRPENVSITCKDNSFEISAIDNSGKETKRKFEISELMSAQKEKKVNNKDLEKRLRNLLVIHKTQVGHLQAISEITNYKNILAKNIPTLNLNQLKIDLNVNCVQIGGQFKLNVDSLVITGNFDAKNPKLSQTIKLDANGNIEVIKGKLDITQLSELQEAFLTSKDKLITGFANEIETKYNNIMYKDSSKSPESFVVEIQKAYNLEEIPVVENIEIEEAKVAEESKDNTAKEEVVTSAEYAAEKIHELEHASKENTPSDIQILVETQIHNLRRLKQRQIDKDLEGITKGKTPGSKAIKMKLEKNLKPETITIDGIDFECTFKVDAVPDTNPPEFSPKITITSIDGALKYSEDKIILSEEDEITFRGKLSDIVEYIEKYKTVEKTTESEIDKNNRDEDIR